MQRIILLAALSALVIFSCQKASQVGVGPGVAVLRTVTSQLRDSMRSSDFSALDGSRGFLTPVASDGGGYLRIPFRGVPLSRAFVLVRMDGRGKVLAGSLVSLTGLTGPDSLLSGSVQVSTLGGVPRWGSPIQTGYIMALHPTLVNRVTVDETLPSERPSDDGTLPEAVVVAYTGTASGGGGVSVGGSYLSLAPLMPGSGSSSAGSGGGAYSPVSPANPASPGGIITNPAVNPKLDYTNTLTVESLQQVFNCMDNNHVPDAGATYTLTMCVDIPVNDDPTAVLTLTPTVSPGHTFFVMNKSNGGQSVTQGFGFYPVSMPLGNLLGNTPSAIKDNGGHEINAQITVSLSATQFQGFKTAALFYMNNSYNLATFNCTDYGVDVWANTGEPAFNLTPIAVIVPEGSLGGVLVPTAIKNSPQGLFQALSAMQANGTPGITINTAGTLMAPTSEGQCPN